MLVKSTGLDYWKLALYRVSSKNLTRDVRLYNPDMFIGMPEKYDAAHEVVGGFGLHT